MTNQQRERYKFREEPKVRKPRQPSKFTLTIRLGNEAMQDQTDIGAALRELGHNLHSAIDTNGTIRDLNGNTVGEWRIK